MLSAPCHPSSAVEQRFRKAQVVGSNPMGGFRLLGGLAYATVQSKVERGVEKNDGLVTDG